MNKLTLNEPAISPIFYSTNKFYVLLQDFHRNHIFELFLNSTFFVKFVQLAQLDKISYAWQFMEPVIILHKSQWPIWESTRPVILGPGFNAHQIFLAKLTNLTNLLSRD